MNSSIGSHQEALKRRWDDRRAGFHPGTSPFHARFANSSSSSCRVHRKILGLSNLDADDVASTVVPPVTVVLEGRSICHRIHLNKHAGYESLAAALRRMFVSMDGGDEGDDVGVDGLDLSNAVPGYMVAYEDMEDDLLLAGDLNWKDFVRVAKRIRIIPAKASRRRRQVSA